MAFVYDVNLIHSGKAAFVRRVYDSPNVIDAVVAGAVYLDRLSDTVVDGFRENSGQCRLPAAGVPGEQVTVFKIALFADLFENRGSYALADDIVESLRPVFSC